MTELKLTELLSIAYQWGMDYGANRSDKNFNDLLQTEAISQALRITNVSKSFCKCSFAMRRYDPITQKAFCFKCKKDIKEAER